MAASTKEITGVSRYDYAYEVLKKSNAARVKEGKNELTMDKDLLEAAMIRAAECAINFDHIRPNGQNCFALNDKIYAENLAEGQESPKEVTEDWLASSGHRTNLLNNDYKSIGIGVFEYKNRLYWVQLFGKVKADTIDEPTTGESTYQIALNKSQESVLLSGAGIIHNPLSSKVSNVKLTAGKKKLTLTWNKKTGITGYEVQISNKKSFKNAYKYTLSGNKKKLVIKKFKGKKLKSKKKYYLRIRAYIETDSKAYSKWKKINKKTK